MTRKVVAAIIAGVVALFVGAGVAFASIPGSDGTIHGCYKTNNPNQGTLIVVDSAATCPNGYTALNWKSVQAGTVYDTVSVTGSYQHDQAAADRIVNCPSGRVAISAWAFAGNDIPLPVVVNNSAQFTTYIEIHVAGSGSGPWPTSAGQLAQGESVQYGMICARISA